MSIEPGTTEYVTSMARRRMKSLANTLQNNNVVIKYMKQYDAYVTGITGPSIIEGFFFKGNANFKRYKDADPIATAYSPNISGFEYMPKQFGGSLVMAGSEDRMNSGPEAAIRLWKSRFEALEYTLENYYNADCLSYGLEDGGLQIGGLGMQISSTPDQGMRGGIDMSDPANAMQRNFAFNTDTDTTGGAPGGGPTTAGNIFRRYDYCVINTSRLQDRPKFALQGATHHAILKSAITSMQRITDDGDSGKAGFPKVYYDAIPYYLAGGISFEGQELMGHDETKWIHPKFLKIQVYKNGDMQALPELQSINQDAKVQIVVHMCNMTCSAPRMLGGMFDNLN